MRKRFLAVLGMFVTALPLSAGEVGFKAVFAKHWQKAKEFTLAVAEAMPAESYDFKPRPEEMSFGQLMVHIAAQNSDSCASATGTTVPSSVPDSSVTPPVLDKASTIKLLNVSFDACAQALAAMAPEQWDKEVYKIQGQPVLASEALWYTFTHMAHHRGQSEVYLRLKNVKPPQWRF